MAIPNPEKTITITLPVDLADAIARMADRDGETMDEFVAKALRQARKADFDQRIEKIHDGWHLRMMRLGLFSEEDLFRYLEA